MRILCWGKTDVGLKRERNEDAFLLNPRTGLYVIADGMGGHAGGELASRIAAQIIDQEMTAAVGEEGAAPPADRMRHAIVVASSVIHKISSEIEELQGMGTTVTSVFNNTTDLILAHVGDSRCYLMRRGVVTQISQDHSLVAEQVRSGIITEEEAKTSSLRHIITRSVGFEPETEVDITRISVADGDVLLLCSDGLANYIEDPAEIAEILVGTDFHTAPDAFVELAKERGGDDNITVILLYVADASTTNGAV